jgi:intein/homing endonuclease
LQRLGIYQKNGTPQMKVDHGIENTLKTQYVKEKKLLRFVTSAIKSLKQKFIFKIFAQKNVVRDGQKKIDHLKKKNVSSVNELLRPNVLIKSASVRKLVQRHLIPVYNLAVEGENEYFANGILVHNCDATSGAFGVLTGQITRKRRGVVEQYIETKQV